MRKTLRRSRKSDVTTAAAPKPAFEPNEWYEALLRTKRDEPERFGRSISDVTARALEAYERARAESMERAA